MRAFMFSVIGGTLGGGAGGVCVWAGVYLLASRSSAAVEYHEFDATMFDVVQHGIGFLSIGIGIAVWAGTVMALRRGL